MTTTEITVVTEHEQDFPEGFIPDDPSSVLAVGGDLSSEVASDDVPSERPADGLELLWVNPRELIIGANVRTDIAYDEEFLADIKDRGVREVIPVRRNADGRLVVRKGQQRVLAAVEANRPEVLVLVEPELLTDEIAREIDRIIDQFNENEKRTQLGEADEVRAVQELLDLKVSAAQIVRKLHIKAKRVKTAIAVASDKTAMDAVADGYLDMFQGAVLAEFTGDSGAIEKLTTAARKRPEQFDHIAQQLRDEYEEARLRAECTARLTEQGVTIVAEPNTSYSGKTRALSGLRANPETKSGTTLTAEEHASCPGHAAYLEYRGWKPVSDRLQAVYVCTSFQEGGHAELYSGRGVVTSGPVTGKMTDEQKAYRNKVIKSGKAWDSAEKVRLKWLKEKFLCRKATPTGAQRWITQMLAVGSAEMYDAMKSSVLALELLGLDKKSPAGARDGGGNPIAAAAAIATPGRATILTVAKLVAALEKRTDRRRSWESPSADVVAYFTQLDRWKYPLSDVERLVIEPDSAKEATTVQDDFESDENDVADEIAADKTEEADQKQPVPGYELADEVVDLGAVLAEVDLAA